MLISSPLFVLLLLPSGYNLPPCCSVYFQFHLHLALATRAVTVFGAFTRPLLIGLFAMAALSELSLLLLDTQALHQPKSTWPLTDSRDSSTSPSSSSGSSTPSFSSSPKTFSPELVRCSRCKRSLSLSKNANPHGPVNIGLNAYYCRPCARVVGYKP